MRRHTEILGNLDEILGSARDWERYEETVGAGLATIPGGARLISRQPTKSRQQVLPLSSNGTIAASTQAQVSNQPQSVFRPERFIVSDSNNVFTIQDLKVGQYSQFLNAGSVPSALFGPGAFGVRLKMDTAQVSMFITAQVTNTDSGAAHAFTAAVVGPSVM